MKVVALVFDFLLYIVLGLFMLIICPLIGMFAGAALGFKESFKYFTDGYFIIQDKVVYKNETE
jgi:ABC-type microcin C transport system permease subunit YejE